MAIYRLKRKLYGVGDAIGTSQRELHKVLKDVRDKLKKLSNISNRRKEERNPEFKRGFPFNQSNFQKEMRNINKEL
jgi:Skp family chaperone for outer membrane proteins